MVKTLKRIKPVYPVSDAGHNKVVTDLMRNSVRVDVYLKNEKLLKTIYVGGESNRKDGSLMLLEKNGNSNFSEENKRYAVQLLNSLRSKIPSNIQTETYNEYVEFCISGHAKTTIIEYKIKDFKKKLETALKKYNIT